MRTFLLGIAAFGLMGCGAGATSFVKSDTTLGRVVVYRNGVAYFERYADVESGSLALNVPQDKIDDFLKSLTVVDAKTGEPASVSYPNLGQSGTIDMRVGGGGPRRLKLTYVTEAPSWKPSYRVIVGQHGRVDVQGWAIVDNTSGEDWKDVKLGVGASSAMSFRYDLKGLRVVQRETLHQNDLMAFAPPTGGAAYGRVDKEAQVMADLDDTALSQSLAYASAPAPADGPVPASTKSGVARHPAPAPPPAAFDQVTRAMNQPGHGPIVVEGFANVGDKDKLAGSLARARQQAPRPVDRQRRGPQPRRRARTRRSGGPEWRRAHRREPGREELEEKRACSK